MLASGGKLVPTEKRCHAWGSYWNDLEYAGMAKHIDAS
jgi:hypothetical protein